MSKLDGEFVRQVASTWHRFEPPERDLEVLAEMLRPMDEAGERLSARVGFDMEPGDFLAGQQAMAAGGDSDD